jgi:pectinesterase
MKLVFNKFIIKVLFIICCLQLAKAAVCQTQNFPSSFSVAKDGSGNFKTIQEAISAVRDLSQQQVKILIKNGLYHEKVIIPSWKTNISLIGESKDNTIISYDDYAGKHLPAKEYFLKTDTLRTFTSYTLLIVGNDCSVENVTIENNAGRVGQAVALHTEGDRITIKNCKLLGNQDTYYAARDGSRVYFKDCYIEGTTDFIFGEATVVFQSCTIKNLVNSYITAASTRPWRKFGFVFFNCKLIADTSVKKVFLGRPWRPYAKTVFINTDIGSQILKEGWDNWKNPANESTVLYAEYKSFGAGANTAERVKWSKQLSTKEAKRYTLRNIFDGWNPQIVK